MMTQTRKTWAAIPKAAPEQSNDTRRQGCDFNDLLAEKTVRRKSLGETDANQGLDLAIGIADEILWSFGLARQVFAVSEMSGRELPGLQDQLSGAPGAWSEPVRLRLRAGDATAPPATGPASCLPITSSLHPSVATSQAAGRRL